MLNQYGKAKDLTPTKTPNNDTSADKTNNPTFVLAKASTGSRNQVKNIDELGRISKGISNEGSLELHEHDMQPKAIIESTSNDHVSVL